MLTTKHHNITTTTRRTSGKQEASQGNKKNKTEPTIKKGIPQRGIIVVYHLKMSSIQQLKYLQSLFTLYSDFWQFKTNEEKKKTIEKTIKSNDEERKW